MYRIMFTVWASAARHWATPAVATVPDRQIAVRSPREGKRLIAESPELRARPLLQPAALVRVPIEMGSGILPLRAVSNGWVRPINTLLVDDIRPNMIVDGRS